MLSFKYFLQEDDIQFTKTDDGSGYHTHTATFNGMNVRIKHSLRMIGNRRKMNISFDLHGRDPKTIQDKNFIFHAVKQSTNNMIKTHGVNVLSWNSSSPQHAVVYNRYAKSIGGETEDHPFAHHEVHLK